MSSDTLCVPDPLIKELANMDTGLCEAAPDVIGNDYAALERLRMTMAERVKAERPLYVCPQCRVAVYLSCRRTNDVKRFYFSHQHEEGNCPAITRGHLTAEELDAIRYNGAKESTAHLQMKGFIEASLRADPRFSGILTEKVWKGLDRKEWRKPDVQARWNDSVPVAFEIQLSTTYLKTIAERRLFYQQEGAVLFWVFKSFKEEAARMFQDDIFYNNNHNLFVVSEETLEASRQQNEFVLDCHWTEPARRPNGQHENEWRSERVRFSELTLDAKKQRVYFFDYDSAREELVQAPLEALREEFFAWWSTLDPPRADDKWHSLRRRLARHDVQTPEHPSDCRALLNALYSAKLGRPIGYAHQKLIQVLHTIADYHKAVIVPLRAALRTYQQHSLVREQDTGHKWAKKVKEYKAALKAGDKAYERDKSLDPLTRFLFPDVAEELLSFDAVLPAALKTEGKPNLDLRR